VIQETQAHVMVMISAPNEDEAVSLARILVEGRLAACVQIHPIRSIYIWQSGLCDDQEQLLLVKTRVDLLATLETTVQIHHPYQVPEITVVPMLMGSAAYLSWMDEQVGGA
jgi:periplasmic divalent cation tolerance protein